MEAGVLQAVEDRLNFRKGRSGCKHPLPDAADFLLVHLVVQERIIVREHTVEDDAADSGLQTRTSLVLVELAECGCNLACPSEGEPRS